MEKVEDIRRYIGVIRRAASLIESLLEDDGGLLERLAQSEVQVPTESKDEVAREQHIKDLMKIDCWPEAVPEFLLAEPTERDQINRARAVMDMVVDRSLEGLSFLDFGCGDGWVTQEATKRGVELALGYDIVPSSNWQKLDSAKFTHSYADLQPKSYDVVFLFDVLDHAQDPVDVMAKVRECVKDTGVVYVRCHPWTSKHATHLYKQGLNKAYIHLFLKWEEIAKLTGKEPIFTRPELNPIEAYNWWFANFEVKKRNIVDEPVSEFFSVPAFKQLLANEQNIALVDVDQFIERMRIQFMDFVLVPKR